MIGTWTTWRLVAEAPPSERAPHPVMVAVKPAAGAPPSGARAIARATAMVIELTSWSREMSKSIVRELYCGWLMILLTAITWPPELRTVDPARTEKAEALVVKQWAAERIQVPEMIAPPQRWELLLRTDTMYGWAWMVVVCPPTILSSMPGLFTRDWGAPRKENITFLCVLQLIKKITYSHQKSSAKCIKW